MLWNNEQKINQFLGSRRKVKKSSKLAKSQFVKVSDRWLGSSRRCWTKPVNLFRRPNNGKRERVSHFQEAVVHPGSLFLPGPVTKLDLQYVWADIRRRPRCLPQLDQLDGCHDGQRRNNQLLGLHLALCVAPPQAGDSAFNPVDHCSCYGSLGVKESGLYRWKVHR